MMPVLNSKRAFDEQNRARRLAVKLTVTLLAAIAIVGCTSNKKKQDTSPMPAAGSVLNVPSAPAAQYTPPPAPQPVVYDTPQQRPQRVIEDAMVDASDDVAYAPEPAPQRQAARKPAVSRGTSYKVKKGESLWTIAETRYGDGNKWKRIAAANPKLNPDKVQAGQTIVLP
jgi:5'-nucleotidase